MAIYHLSVFGQVQLEQVNWQHNPAMAWLWGWTASPPLAQASRKSFMHPRSARIRPTSVASQHVCGCLRLDAYPQKNISARWLAQFVQTPVKNDDVKGSNCAGKILCHHWSACIYQKQTLFSWSESRLEMAKVYRVLERESWHTSQNVKAVWLIVYGNL